MAVATAGPDVAGFGPVVGGGRYEAMAARPPPPHHHHHPGHPGIPMEAAAVAAVGGPAGMINAELLEYLRVSRKLRFNCAALPT